MYSPTFERARQMSESSLSLNSSTKPLQRSSSVSEASRKKPVAVPQSKSVSFAVPDKDGMVIVVEEDDDDEPPKKAFNNKGTMKKKKDGGILSKLWKGNKV